MNRTRRPPLNTGSRTARIAIRLVIGIAVLSISLVGFQILKTNRPKPAQVQDRQSGRLVEVIEARMEVVSRSFTGYGTTRAVRSSTVAAQITARITSRPDEVRAGGWIDSGETLVLLEPEVFLQRRNAAAAALESLRSDLDALDVELESTQERLRLSDMSIELIDSEITELVAAQERGAAMQIEIDRLRRQRTTLELERESLQQILAGIPSRRSGLESRITAQRAELALTEIDLDRADISAPISGVLAEVFVDEGDSVAPGEPVARIVDLRTIEVPLQISASASRLLAQGDRAVVRESAGQRTFEGVVSRIAPEINPQSRTVTAYIEIHQDIGSTDSLRLSELLLPGQFVSGEVVSGLEFSAITVPRLAVQADRVMVLEPESGTAQPRTASVSYYTELPDADEGMRTQWAVLDPAPPPLPEWMPPRLKEGELVIVSNIEELPTGTPVRAQREDSTGP